MNKLSLVLTLISALSAQTQPPKKEDAIIEGFVSNAITGEPISNARISFAPRTPAPGRITPIYSTLTDAEGRFRMRGIPPGSYSLSAAASAFISKSQGYSQDSNKDDFHSITAGQHIKNLNVKLMPEGIVSGHLIDSFGDPVVDARVVVLRSTRGRGTRKLHLVTHTYSNEFGEYRIPNLWAGRYLVQAIPPISIQGAVNRQELIPTFYPFSISESGAVPVDISTGQTLSNIDIRVERSPVFQLRGKVTGASTPIRNVYVQAYPRGSDPRLLAMLGPRNLVKPDGSFALPGIPPGAYTLVAHAGNTMRTIGRTQVNVTQGDVKEIQFPIFEDLTIKGSIRIDGQVRQEDQMAKHRLRIGVIALDDFNSRYQTFPVKEDGSFKILEAGVEKLALSVLGLPQALWLKSITSNGRDITNTGLDLTSGAVNPIEITLGVGTGSIAGTVENANPGMIVMVTPDPFQPERYESFQSVIVNEKGMFKIGNLPPGPYKIYAWKNFDPATHTDPEFLKAFESKAKRVTIKADTEENQTLTVIEQP